MGIEISIGNRSEIFAWLTQTVWKSSEGGQKPSENRLNVFTSICYLDCVMHLVDNIS